MNAQCGGISSVDGEASRRNSCPSKVCAQPPPSCWSPRTISDRSRVRKPKTTTSVKKMKIRAMSVKRSPALRSDTPEISLLTPEHETLDAGGSVDEQIIFLMDQYRAEDNQVRNMLRQQRRRENGYDPVTMSKFTVEDYATTLKLVISDKWALDSISDMMERQAILAHQDHCEFYLLLVHKLYCMLRAVQLVCSDPTRHGRPAPGETLRYSNALIHRPGGLEAVQRTRIGKFVAFATSWVVQRQRGEHCHPAGMTNKCHGAVRGRRHVDGGRGMEDALGSLFQLIYDTDENVGERYVGVARILDFANLATILGGADGLRRTMEGFACLMIRSPHQEAHGAVTPPRPNNDKKNEWVDNLHGGDHPPNSNQKPTIHPRMVDILLESSSMSASKKAWLVADMAIAHLMTPNKGSYEYGVETGLHEVLAAETLKVPVSELKRMPRVAPPPLPGVSYTTNRTKTASVSGGGDTMHHRIRQGNHKVSVIQAAPEEYEVDMPRPSYGIQHLFGCIAGKGSLMDRESRRARISPRALKEAFETKRQQAQWRRAQQTASLGGDSALWSQETAI